MSYWPSRLALIVIALAALIRVQAQETPIERINMLPAGQTRTPVKVEFPEGFVVSPIARATIFVRDLEESLKLYRDILGLKPWFDNYWKGSSINDIMGTKGLELRATVLRSGDAAVGNIGLYQLYKQAGEAPVPSQRTDTRIGDVAVVFHTTEIDRLTEEIIAAGYAILSPPVVLMPRADMAVQGREMMFRDRDGVLVNLVQSGVPKSE
jgi:catechol 2,3-dioxygenase-like lactoylglutathione lyase family enzyme